MELENWVQLPQWYKRQIIAKSLQNGITNIKDIQDLYNRGMIMKDGGILESKNSFRTWLKLNK